MYFSETFALTGLYLNMLYGIFVVGVILFGVKKLMSVIQLISASEQLAEIDIEERKEKEKKK